VVLTYNRADEVARTVEHLLSLPERPDVVVVDNASTDGTADALRRAFARVTVLRQRRNLGAAGRNAGLRASRRPYLALCDDDTWWEPGSLRRAADLLDAHPRLAVVTARVLVGSENRLDSTCAAMAASPLPSPPGMPGAAILGFLAGASVVRREALLEVGGFEQHFFLMGEEELIALDLVTRGWHLAYLDELVVHHHPSAVNRDQPGRRRLIARNGLWVAWLRRPLRRALARTLGVARRASADPAMRRALVEFARGLPWALRRRRAVPPRVERLARLLETAGSS
jgi:GT2 family glycosyltransferase